jgi:PTS system nitrogen regulatory IIA component
MKISSIITPADVIIGLKAKSKKQVLQEITRRMTSHLEDFDQRLVLDQLMERERLGCTGIGDGIAIPHTRCSFPEDQQSPLMCLTLLDPPVDYEAHDDKPVDIIFTLLAPENSGGEHLTVLALASRILGDKNRANQIRRCDNADAVWSILKAKTLSSAA